MGEAPATSFADPFTSYEIRYGVAILSGKSNHIPPVLPRVEIDHRNTRHLPLSSLAVCLPLPVSIIVALLDLVNDFAQGSLESKDVFLNNVKKYN